MINIEITIPKSSFFHCDYGILRTILLLWNARYLITATLLSRTVLKFLILNNVNLLKFIFIFQRSSVFTLKLSSDMQMIWLRKYTIFLSCCAISLHYLGQCWLTRYLENSGEKCIINFHIVLNSKNHD